MKVFVYGTLKSGYGNNRLLQGAEYLGEDIVNGYKMFYSYGTGSFPVITEADGKIKGEVYKIDPNRHLRDLDALEGEGRMYHRKTADTNGGHEVHLYVGGSWFDYTQEVPVVNDTHEWGR